MYTDPVEMSRDAAKAGGEDAVCMMHVRGLQHAGAIHFAAHVHRSTGRGCKSCCHSFELQHYTSQAFSQQKRSCLRLRHTCKCQHLCILLCLILVHYTKSTTHQPSKPDTGLSNSKPGSQQELSGRQPEISERALEPDYDVMGTRTPPHNPRSPAFDASPAGALGFTPMSGTGGASNAMHMAQNMQQQGVPTAEKV